MNLIPFTALTSLPLLAATMKMLQMRIFLIPWVVVSLASAQDSGKSPLGFGAVDLFQFLRQPNILQLPLTLQQHEALHQQAQREFLRQQRQFHEQLLGRQPFSPSAFATQQLQISSAQTVPYPADQTGLSNLFAYPTQTLPPRSLPMQNTQNMLQQAQPTESPYYSTPVTYLQKEIPTVSNIEVAYPKKSAESAEIVVPNAESSGKIVKLPSLMQQHSFPTKVSSDADIDAQVIQIISEESNAHKVNVQKIPKNAKENSPTRIHHRNVVHGQTTHDSAPIQENNDPNTHTNNRDESIDKRTDEGPDIQKLFGALGLSAEEKKEIVSHVEELLKQEIAKKILANILPKVNAADFKKFLSTNTNSSDAKLSNQENHEIKEVNNKAPGSISISKEPKEIRESQPKIAVEKSDLNVKKENKIEEHRVHQNNQNLEVRKTKKTTNTHISFDDKIPEQGIGKIITRKINTDEAIDKIIESVPPTGAPLDLREADSLKYSTENPTDEFYTSLSPTTITTTTEQTTSYKPLTINTNYLPPRIRNRPHVVTAFERLANDYRERLQGTDSVSKLLASFYKDAYIVLRQRDINSTPKKHGNQRRAAPRQRRRKAIRREHP